MYPKYFAGVAFLLVAASLSAAVDFQKDIEPLLKERCQGCHGAAQQMAGLRLDSRDAALRVIKPGNGPESKLVNRLSGKGGAIMPPVGKKLTPEEIAKVTEWINGGVRWAGGGKSAHWAFQPVRRSAEPNVANAKWARNAIDKFVLARLEKESIQPASEASKRTLLRRLSLDITGLPPTTEEMDAYLADTSANAYDRAVQRLLSSPRFGERWARPWLDRARYADSDGYEKDWMRPYAWRYRHWVINALNNDMPFDRFTVEQIAGDLLPNATVEQKVAAGFHRQTLTNREGGVDNNQFRFENTVDRVNTVSAAWLGLTTGCTQCHDHKYDPLTQKDFYSLFAFFENLDEVEIDAPMPGEMLPYLRKRDEYRAKREALLAEYKVDEFMVPWETRMLDAHANPGKYTDWDLGWAVLATLTEGGDGEKIIQKPRAQRSPYERDILIDHFVKNYHFAVGQKVYEKSKLKELDKKLAELKTAYPRLTQAMSVNDGPETAHHVRVRGDFRNKGAEVRRGTPEVLPPLRANGAPTRLDLAQWVASKENPLTARVTVNWVWQEIFGRGLVRTPEDFGTRADPPTHPELLDWLASEFVDRGWSLKELVRTIVTSAAYRQSSNTRPELQQKDPGNMLLARQSRVRLPAESIRDSALVAAGLLSDEVGGKSIFPPQPAGVTELSYGNRWGVVWPESQGRDRYKRGLYIHFQRSTPYPMLMNFDAPKSNAAVCKRERSNTALQALNLLNDPVFVEAAETLAYQAIAARPDFDSRLAYACERALGRLPNDREKAKFRAYFDRQRAIFDKEGDSALAVAPAEAAGLTRPEAAAWVAMSSVLLNLDEFVTKE